MIMKKFRFWKAGYKLQEIEKVEKGRHAAPSIFADSNIKEEVLFSKKRST